MKKILAIAVLSIVLSCCSDDQEERCNKLYKDYSEIVKLANGNPEKLRGLELQLDARLEEAGCIK